MFDRFLYRLKAAWRRTSRLDRVALGVVGLYAVVWLVRAFGGELPFSGLFGFFFLLASGYGAVRLFGYARHRLLWSLRNRLIVAYLFIAVVPILLLVTMAGLSAYILYYQLGAYLLNEDVRENLARLENLTDVLLAAAPPEGRSPPATGEARAATSERVSSLLAIKAADLPGLEVKWNEGAELLPPAQESADRRFTGLYEEKGKIWLRSVLERKSSGGRALLSLMLPLDSAFLERLVPQLGMIQLTAMQPVDASAPAPEKGEFEIQLGGRRFRGAGRIATERRSLPPPAGWLDYEIAGLAKLEAVALERQGGERIAVPIFASFSARPSELNHRLFSSLGELSDLPVRFLLGIGVLFLLLEMAALFIGVRMTRSITTAVSDLYRATQHVQAGDLSHRIRIERRDQLGVLADSFNTMTSSVAAAIEEQRRRERLENELAIAREVQTQLFPRAVPRLPGLELAAVCRAARTVSGDYYDFIPIGTTEVGIVVADISGKGISAALLMASLQAALRSQLLLNGASAPSTAEIVARLNRHLVMGTTDDRYATLFFAIYNSATRVLRYTNAGHHPPLYFSDNEVTKLEAGGTVIGLFQECAYEQGCVTIAPGSLLMAYTDGLVEPENVFGEEFGSKRLVSELLRHRQAPIERIAETLIGAVEEWAGSPEPRDDMTLVLASVR